MAGHPGKRGRAVELSTDSTTPGHTEQKDEHFAFKNTLADSNVITTTTESIVVDLFGIGAKEGRMKETRPFIHRVHFHGPQGEVVRVWANVDDGAMKEVMSSAMFNKVKHRLGTQKPSNQLLRLANGTIVQSEARWEGEIEVDGVRARVAFEVFDSGGKWDFLFGKSLLETYKAIHNYELYEIVLKENSKKTTLHNQSRTANQAQPEPKPETLICVVTEEPQQGEEQPAEVNMEAFQEDSDQFTCMMNPFKREHVQEILRLVTIGDDLTSDEQQKVYDLVESFADIFALSVNKVKIVEGAVHRLDIPKDTTFSMKVHQKPLTTPQCRYLYESIDKMLEAGVIELCKPEDVKCISATTLAQKAHQGKGHSLTELQHRVNDECIINGMDARFDLPPRTTPTPDDSAPKDTKWRICQNFSQTNKITKVSPMPQGDIRAKQQRLSGH
jgi:hypothetical protein